MTECLLHSTFKLNFLLNKTKICLTFLALQMINFKKQLPKKCFVDKTTIWFCIKPSCRPLNDLPTCGQWPICGPLYTEVLFQKNKYVSVHQHMTHYRSKKQPSRLPAPHWMNGLSFAVGGRHPLLQNTCQCQWCKVLVHSPSHKHRHTHSCTMSPSPPLDNIRVMVIVWRLRGNIIRTALCWIVWHKTFTVRSTLIRAVLTGPTDWVCHIRTLTLCMEAVA